MESNEKGINKVKKIDTLLLQAQKLRFSKLNSIRFGMKLLRILTKANVHAVFVVKINILGILHSRFHKHTFIPNYPQNFKCDKSARKLPLYRNNKNNF